MKQRLSRSIRFESPAMREVSLRIQAVSGVNLGQGICMMPTPEVVQQGAVEAVRAGKNLYSPAAGVQELRDQISRKLSHFNKAAYKPAQICVTSGAIAAFEAVCQSLLEPGDEVVSFRPFYPYHHNLLHRKGAVVRYIDMSPPNWDYDPEKLREAFSSKTKFVLLNTPNNPTGKVFSRAELEQIAALCKEFDVLCVTDEVYEYMTFDGREHLSVAALPGMLERTITTSSFSKTFAITGWRIGYFAAPEDLFEPIKTLYDQMYVCAPTPLQHAVAKGVEALGDSYFADLRRAYEGKREIILSGLEAAGFICYQPQGTYFLIADTRERFPGMSSEEVVNLMIEKAQVGAVPGADILGPEVKGDPKRSFWLRFAFAVPDEWLERAAVSLKKLN